MKKNIFIIGGVIIFVIFASIFIFESNRTARPKALIAFVIDDWGYNKKNINLVFQIERPLTLSILPRLRYSKYITERINKDEMYDLILHLPLESRSNRVSEVNTIRTNMEDEKIVSILEEDVGSIPGIVGVSNHQGSKATANKKVMRVILRELKKRNLFFLDSLTTPDSVCADVAKGIGVRHARRDVFLDLTDQTDLEHFESYIRKQIKELASIAVRNGSAIGIGHNIEITLKAIKDSIPELEEQGIKIVPLKELMK